MIAITRTLVLGLVLGGAAAASPELATLTLSKVNGVHVDLAPELLPIERGPLSIRVSSPSQRMAVHGNRLALRRLRDDLIAADFTVELEGEGRLVAVIKAGVESRLEDEVVVPRQELRVAGSMRLARRPDGYEITFEELPETLAVTIESRLLGQLVKACRGLASFLPLDCDGVGRELSTARIPLPARGDKVFLAAGWLSDEERAVFDRFAGPPAGR
ncbi:MAG: hypothetical protein D6696_00680 [Acidobacteria bacterium]|nr:MAG: hypothetical protein D6696_00680 [Acidobacteriota bacterium]